MKKIFTRLFALLLLSLVTTSAWAQFENGKVYRIVCSGTNSVSLGASALTDVAAVSTSETEKAQQWYVTVSGSNYTFRNLANGRYLLGNNSTSNAWGLTETSNDFTVTVVNGNYAIRGASHANGYGYMHKDGGNNIVSWESGAANSQWTPIEVSYTAAELQAVWNEVEALVVPSSTVSGYQEKLDAIFSDKACTVLKSEYTSANMSNANLENDENYSALPQVLKDMVKKVRGGDWSEKTVAPADRPNGNNNTNHNLWTVADTWDNDYAKKFRVQMYEPYSVEGEITNYLRINAHCNMDNPTGIYANAGEPMYIMVEGTIEDGAELWVAHQVGHGATNYYNNVAYTQLKEGLNVVPYFADGSQLWINYVVHTYNVNEKTIEEKFPHKLSEYKPLKIHIEGGKINGFFNAMGDYRSTEVSGDANGGENLWGEVDNDADWNYYKARAALSGDFALLGHRQTLLFDFGTWNSTNGYFGVANDGGGIEKALAWHLENIEVPATPNCYAGSGKAFGNYSDTYYPGMQLSATTGKINIMLEAWDRIQYSEHASLGLLSVANIEKMNALYPRWTKDGKAAEIYNYGSATVNGETKTYKDFCQGIDYSEYFNHHGAAVGAPSGYMSGGWRVCNYHYNTMGSIIGKIAAEAGPTWGPAHEIGHQHQTIFNLNGQTEVTNNFHSNVAVWYMGMGTSRVNGSEGSLASVLGAFNTDNNDLYTNNIWAITHLYYRLWLYYHLAGNNTQFWPRLFELLRQVPIVNGGQISGETSLLRFYQHACDAAGEDLTEFFRAHGFFEIMTDRLVGDYSNGTYNVTEEQIETAISAVKAKGYPNNYAILLINDGTEETTVKHDGTTPRALWDNNPSAEYGSVTDFIEGNTSVTTAYEATVSADGTVTMSGGTGGVGFLVFNEKGELVSFSNKSTFALSDEAAYLLATGKAELVALDGENNKTEANVDLTAVQSSLIVSLVADVENLLKYVDDTYTKVGYFKASSVVDLQSALETAKATIETGTGLAAAYELLYTEYQNVLNNENAKVAIISGAKYAIKSKSGNDYMDVDNSGNVKTTGSSELPTDDSDLWIIEIASKDTYKIKNASTGKYLQEVSDANSVNFTVGDNAVNYGITNVDYVYHAFSTKKCPGRYMDRFSATQVATWGELSDNNKWLITLVDDDLAEKSLATAELQALIEKTENLVNSLATVSTTNVLGDELSLQCTAPGENYYISCSNPHPNGNDGAGGVAALLDNNNGTYLHTNYTSGQVSATNDYLQVYLGDGNELNLFRITGVQRSSVYNDFPKDIEIQGSLDGTEDSWTTITTVTDLSTEAGATWERDVKSLRGYEYLRFIVTTTNNRIYFHMAEFSIFNLTLSVSAALLDEYNEYSATLTEQLITEAYEATERGKEWIACSDATAAELEAYASTLQDKYDALYTAYKKVIDAEKAKLQSIIDDTEGLITQVGTATVTADAKIDLLGKLYAESPYTAGGTSDSDYSSAENGYNLLDGNTGTHFHSDYNYSTMVSPPYLRVDLGKGNSARKVNFNYTTRNKTGCAPTIINVYGGVAAVAGVEYSQGAIQSSAALNAVTTPTKIVIKNLSGTNSKYFAGASNETDINAAVLVWEPVEDGVAGRYYLRTTDAVSGYIQNGNTTVELGTIDNAQVFVTTSPSTTGADATYFNGESLVNADLDNLVRFVQEGGSTWLNVQHGETGTPCLGHTGKGGWTVHNVYLVTETDNDTPSYDATPIATFTSGDASNPLPTGTSAKWTSADMESTKDYRFFKFEVAESQGSKTENGNTKYYFAISEFGFNIVGEESATINAKYNGIVSEELLIDTRRTVNASETMADYAADYVVTVEQIKAQTAAQQAAYDALNEAMVGTDKSELEALIEATTILKGQLYETVITSYTANEVTLSITEGEPGYIYCNAPEKNSTSATDNAGVAALIDLTDGNPNLETFLHTEYGNDQSEDGLDHYLRVDLGENKETAYLEFGYVGRGGHLSKSPKTVIVAATNDLNGEWTTIKTLTMAEPSATVETKTGALGNGNDYRYWRFMVTENHSGGKDGNGHPYFALTDFNVYKCTGIVKDEQLKYTPNIYIYTTSELVTEVEDAITAAEAVVADKQVSQAGVDAAVEALQAVYDKLAEAINYYWCPVELTVDVANPALYIIDAIGRGDGKAWQYNAQNNNITIVDKDESNLYHLWYFMLGGEEQTVKIIPVMTPEYGLSATDFTNGIDKVSAVAENCVNWSFAYVNNYYNFKPHGHNIYLSNYNGGSNPLGFYDSADGGSYVNFTAVEVEDYALTRLAKLAEGKSVVTAGTTVGSYDEATCEVYNEALEAANGLVAAASSMPQEYVNAFTRLFNANNGLRIHLPDSAKYYVLRCNHEDRYIYVNADNKLQWASSSYDKAQSRAVWQFEEIDASNGTCKMKSLHTQSYLSGTSDSQWAFGEEGKVVTLVKSPSVEGALVFKVDGYENNGLHAHGENNTVISHTNDADANHYFFEEVEVVTGIKHDVTMKTKFSSVTLGYNATVPAGVEAYNAVGLDDGYVSLVKVEGEVIPANTPVILYRTDGDSEAKTFTFTYTDKTAEKPASTLLGGSLYTKYVQCDDSDYYKLMIKNGEAKMYLMYKEFNAQGVSQGATHAGGHIKCSANKIYMRVPAAQGIASYGMRFVDYGTTDIDDVKGESGDAKTIYDLQGRKLTEITEPGFYIVDGKKVYVK